MNLKTNVYELMKQFVDIQEVKEIPTTQFIKVEDKLIITKINSGEILIDLMKFTINKNKNTLKYVFVDTHSILESFSRQDKDIQPTFIDLIFESIILLYNIDVSLINRQDYFKNQQEGVLNLMECVAEKVKAGKSRVFEFRSNEKESQKFEKKNSLKLEKVLLTEVTKQNEQLDKNNRSIMHSNVVPETDTSSNLVLSILTQTLKIKKKAVG